MTAKLFFGAIFLLTATASGCAVPMGSTVSDKQSYVRKMRDDTLTQLYSFNPALRGRVQQGAGFAIFSNLDIYLGLLSTTQGFGIAVDNRTGGETYMRMTRFGAGLGAGLKDFRTVFLFKDPTTFQTFLDKGWEFGSDGEAALIAGGRTGVALGVQASAQPSGFGAGGQAQSGLGSFAGGGHVSRGSGVEIYQITKNGVVLQATLAGTKYSRDTELN
jgi:hypothetical protein